MDLWQDDEYKRLIRRHIKEMLSLLLQKGIYFAIVCDKEAITFEPELPESIASGFGKSLLFVLGNNTFSTASVDDGTFSFEAGFGSENVGAQVSMPLLAIKQIIIEDIPILLNLAAPAQNKQKEGSSRSMEALLKNPENLKLLKKKKNS